LSSTGQAKVTAYDAGTNTTADLRDPIDYLAARTDELSANIEKIRAMIAGAKETERSLRDERIAVEAELKAARAAREG
jgi:hypothetical protein